jgi:hypothetical protein
MPAASPVQMGLFDSVRESDGAWETIDQTVATITRKFGPDAVKRGTLKES